VGARLNQFPRARRVLLDAVAARAFPAAVIEVGDATRIRWREPFGRLTYDAQAAPATDDTIFDLASLTKVIATTPLLMQQVERGAIGLDDPVSTHIAEWQGEDRAPVTIRDLLAHSSGLPGGWVQLFREYAGADAFRTAICRIPLEYAPGTTSVYSDLGFILLGLLLDAPVPLPVRFVTMLSQMSVAEEIQFNPPSLWLPRTAPTAFDPWRGRQLVGEVDDENTCALGGAAGHAGLFGTVKAVGGYARHLLQILDGRTGVVRRDTLETFIRRDARVPDSSRALGWDTMLPTSSCGTRMSPRAFGHTGFTGTSLWIDPEAGIYVALLTNRVHPTRENNAIQAVRPAVHDAVMAEL